MRYSPYDEFITFGTVPAALRLLYNPHANQAGIQDQVNVSELLASDPSFSVNSDALQVFSTLHPYPTQVSFRTLHDTMLHAPCTHPMVFY